MCEFLDTSVQKSLQLDQIGQILHSTILNIDGQHEDLTLIAVKALNSIITQTEPILQNKEQRDFIMNGICKAVTMENDDISEKGLECLNEFPIVAYPTLEEYIQTIGSITMNFLQSQNYQQIKGIL